MNVKEYNKQYYKDHIEEAKQYYLENKEKLLVQQKQYNCDHEKQRKEYNKQWQKDHKTETREYEKFYMQTKNGKEVSKRYNFKHRQLGFIPLNEPFDGCEGHHISKNFVIYLPKKLHRYLYHNIWTWKNMEQINKLAIEYL